MASQNAPSSLGNAPSDAAAPGNGSVASTTGFSLVSIALTGAASPTGSAVASTTDSAAALPTGSAAASITGSAAASITGSAAASITGSAANSTTGSAAAVSSGSGDVSTGAVVGIAIGIAIGVALIAVLVTFLIMRRQEKARRRRAELNTSQRYELKPSNGEAKSKVPIPSKVDDLLPQPADDGDVRGRTRTIFDQVNQYVQNFCLARPGSEMRLAVKELAAFECSGVWRPLSSSLQNAKDGHPLIKSSLVHHIVGKITLGAPSQETLLPADLVFLANATTINNRKSGLSRCLSQWRALTAFVRPDPSSDVAYLAERDRRIAQSVHTFLRAFAPWMKPRYTEKDQSLALTTILQEAAALGIFLLSQPQELTFRWPQGPELAAGTLALSPELQKVTDEHGQPLRSPQKLVSASVVKL